MLQTALYEFAEKDRVVLMGRSGQWLLRGIPHVLRVRVMARRQDRGGGHPADPLPSSRSRPTRPGTLLLVRGGATDLGDRVLGLDSFQQAIDEAQQQHHQACLATIQIHLNQP